MTVSKNICAIDSGFLKSENHFTYSDGTLRSAEKAKLIEWVNKWIMRVFPLPELSRIEWRLTGLVSGVHCGLISKVINTNIPFADWVRRRTW